MNASEMLTKLKALVGEVGKVHFERVALAYKLLGNKEWIESEFNGDDWKAAEFLEEECFGDLCGAMSLWDLLKIRQHFPKEADWARCKWNLAKLMAECKTDTPKVTRTAIKKADYEAVQQQAAESAAMLKKERRESASKDERIAKLEKDCTRLNRENAVLRGRIEELERLLGKKFGMAGVA